MRRRRVCYKREPMRVLYVSQTGMLEGLGRSQVLGYLRGLARRGVAIDLVSFELAAATAEARAATKESMAAAGIAWHPLERVRDPRLRVKVLEAGKGLARAVALARRLRPDIVHGRSSFATAIAEAASKTTRGARLLYDCRGMLGEEYVDAGYWTRDRIEYRLVKGYEMHAFRRANGVVVLTRALEAWLRDRGALGARTETEVIPCCADLEHFDFRHGDRQSVRAELGLDGLVLVYAGSLGSASSGSFYREADMARFARTLRERASERVRFLVLTPSASDELLSLLDREGFPRADVVVRKVEPARMPAYLAAGDIALSFIVSAFSKMGSSPTKVAEYLGCGLPTVLNGDIGDQADLVREPDAAVVIDAFDGPALIRAADAALALARRPLEERVASGRRVAERHFDLERVGVARYEHLYDRMIRQA